MEVQNCVKCGRLFYNISDTPICPECWQKASEKIHEIEEYVGEHREGDLYTVAEACHVEPDQVSRWLKDKRIQFSEDSALKVPCEVCGSPIHSGKLCEKCREQEWAIFHEISEGLEESGKAAQKEAKSRRGRKDAFFIRNRM